MKKFYLFLFALLLCGFSLQSLSQCLSTSTYGLYPSTTYTPSCTGLAETICTDGYAGEYSRVNVVSGTQYIFSSSIATDYITIADNPATSTNPATTAYATGTGSVTWTATLTGTIRFITHTSAACGNAAVDRARRVQCGTPAANDASVQGAYTVGKTPKSYHTIYYAVVKNNGSGTLTNVSVTLNVTGANTYTNTKTIASLASNAETTVYFDAFQSGNTGTNNISVTVPSDDNNTNNSKTTTQTVTTNGVGSSSLTTATTGVGSSTGAIEMAAKFRNTGSKTIDQVTIYFPSGSTGQPYIVKIYDATGAGSTPGTALFTSATQTTNGANLILAVSPAVVVSGDFFVSVSQTGSTNLGLGYEAQTPLDPATYFFKTTGAWGDIGAPFKLMMDARFSAGLPVTLISFTGSKSGTNNLLSWSTANEQDNKGFELERSVDGQRFSSIGFVATNAAGGNSTGTLNYTFVDKKRIAGTNYYRLRQINLDGRTSYSSVVTLKGDLSGLVISATYPNPVKTELTMAVNAALTERATITITDISGKIVKQQEVKLVLGENQINLNVGSLSSGIYHVKLVTASETKTTKFVKN